MDSVPLGEYRGGMLFRPSILSQAVGLVPWDLRESHGDKHLLVWGDVPHWMVVDDEMLGFLERLDGTCALGRVIRAVNGSPRLLVRVTIDLHKRGMLGVPGKGTREVAAPPQPRLESIAINMTARCNLRCSFCYARDDRAGNTDSEVVASEIIQFLKDVTPFTGKPCSLVMLGGEPFLVAEKTLAVAAKARTQGLTTIVSTNGTLISADIAREARRVRLQVQVSIDGPDAELHEQVRGKGTFARAMEGVEELTRAGTYTVISMVCHEGNVDRLEDFFDLARRLGVQEARFIPLKQIGAARDSGFRPVQMSRLMRTACSLFRRRPDLLSLLGRDALSILANTCRYSARRASCGTGLQTILLDANGTLYPCLNMTEPQFGLASIRDTGYDFGQLWRDSSKLERLRHDTSVETPTRACSRCPVRYWCLGGCRGETLAVTRQLSSPAPGCADLKRTMLDMMWMLAESPELIRPALKIC